MKFLSVLIGLMLITSAAGAEPRCFYNDLLDFQYPLPHTEKQLHEGKTFKIVALGSSSTAGAGASDPSHAYPAQLQAVLQSFLPTHEITVVNRGVNGDMNHEMLARLQRDVIDEHPDLVIWQLGTNAILTNQVLVQMPVVGQVLWRLRKTKADVVMMDPQYSPKVLVQKDYQSALGTIGAFSRVFQINVFRRFELMKYWHDHEQMAFSDYLNEDRVHLNDWAYSCIALTMATSILRQVKTPL